MLGLALNPVVLLPTLGGVLDHVLNQGRIRNSLVEASKPLREKAGEKVTEQFEAVTDATINKLKKEYPLLGWLKENKGLAAFGAAATAIGAWFGKDLVTDFVKEHWVALLIVGVLAYGATKTDLFKDFRASANPEGTTPTVQLAYEGPALDQ